MKVFLSVEDITAEINVKVPFSPDVLQDICHRAAEMVIQQRAATVVLEDADPAT